MLWITSFGLGIVVGVWLTLLAVCLMLERAKKKMGREAFSFSRNSQAKKNSKATRKE